MTKPKFKAGDKIKENRDGSYRWEILYVGKHDYFCNGVFSGTELSMNIKEIDNLYSLYTPPKKTVRMWPALVKWQPLIAPPKYGFKLSDGVYPNEEDAIYYISEHSFVKFPANENIYSDVPVEDG